MHLLIQIFLLLLLLLVPYASRMLPEPEFKPIAMSKWILVIALVFFAQSALKLFSHFHSGNDLANNGFLVFLLVIVAAGTAFTLSRNRTAP